MEAKLNEFLIWYYMEENASYTFRPLYRDEEVPGNQGIGWAGPMAGGHNEGSCVMKVWQFFD
jgi:hypothetical protein